MKNIIWINLLHFYQPPTASSETVIEAAEKSYIKTVKTLARNPHVKFTVNITGCLLEKLDNLGYKNLIADLKKLYSKKQIEITGTAAFHPLLPLIPASEVKRNIEINESILKKYFGKNIKPAGFFLPEMAYSRKVASIIADFGYKWIALDEISASGQLDKVDFNKSYFDKSSGLNIFFRSRSLSRSYVPDTLLDLIKKNFSGLAPTATDAELYGLRHDDQAKNLEKIIKNKGVKYLTVSEYLGGLKEKIEITPSASSWETTVKELKKGQPFNLWNNPKNKIHQLLWRLAALAIAAVNDNQSDTHYSWARSHLDRGLASCTFWWASGHDFHLFGSISWSPDEIERGVNELIKSVRSLNSESTKDAKIAAEKLYIKIKQAIWHKHWNYYWNKKTE